MKHFPLDKNYAELLKAYGISVDELLKRAGLPVDTFAKEYPCVTAKEYYRFMKAIEDIVDDNEAPVMLATADNIETITPPIFGEYCSANARECIKRIAQYKALAGAVKFEVCEDERGITVIIKGEEDTELPEIIIGIEMVLLVNLIRKATKENIIPVNVSVRTAFTNQEYEKFLNKKAEKGEFNSVTFSYENSEIPFVTRNESMWSFFEPELKKRLNDMDVDNSMSAKVRSVLIDILPAGKTGIDDVATALGISKRSLQRKLKEEETTYQKQLNHIRELLAKNYIQNTNLSSEDIAYLLGYQDINSFFRAFSVWTGENVTSYRQKENNLQKFI